jgi:putative redox protein
MKITTLMLSDEVFVASNDNGNTITLDSRKREVKQSLSPVENLLASLASCAAIDIVSILKKRKKSIAKFTIETEGVRHETDPKYFISIHCEYIITSVDVNESELDKVAALSLEKYCSVAQSLKSKISFSVRVERPATHPLAP